MKTNAFLFTITLILFYLTINICLAKNLQLPLQHATKYQPPQDITQYWISEKLDGVRGYWTGSQLLTRQGNTINAPIWFTQHWPNIAMDGELFNDRNQFQAIVSCVRQKIPDDNCWRNIKLMIFDLPQHKGTFTERIKAMKTLINNNAEHLAMIEQFRLSSLTALEEKLTEIVDKQGEGLMLHFQDAYYHLGRSNNLMKLKKFQDEEALVIGHVQGKGKYQGKMGALIVKNSDNITFKVGSGFSDLQRKNPPNVGTKITYKYTGKTLQGVPRFASFLRIRE